MPKKKTYKRGSAAIYISKNKYKALILKRQKKPLSLTKKENYDLDFTLNRKYCNCIEHIKYKTYSIGKNKRTMKNRKKNNKNKSQKNKPSKSKNNPYALCTSSIYKKRGFRIPKTARKNCLKLYNK
tara:strand:- start:317 stop:694 length:378 start_codon:yes stop_codon:yes gene_type:complete